MTLHPFRQRHLLIQVVHQSNYDCLMSKRVSWSRRMQVHHAEGVPIAEADIGAAESYCSLTVGTLRCMHAYRQSLGPLTDRLPPLRMTTAAIKAERVRGIAEETFARASSASSSDGGVLSPSASFSSSPPVGPSQGLPFVRKSKAPPEAPLLLSWGDIFLLREDDMTLGDMSVTLEVVMSKRWPVPDPTLAVVSV